MKKLHLDKAVDRRLGAIVGLAVGDALGAAVEFKPKGTFEPVTGYRGGGPHPINPGDWTDDTSMAIAIAESLSECEGVDREDMMDRFALWHSHGEFSVNGKCFDIGIQTSTALRSWRKNRSLDDIPASDRNSGNGSIMRLAPIVAYQFEDPFELRMAARASSATTHPSQLCQDSCEAMATVMDSLIHGMGVPPNSKDWMKLFITEDFDARVMQRIAGATDRKDPKGGGFVLDCLEASLHAVTSTLSFKKAVLFAVNLGDDADTTGAVTGQIAGSHYGLSGIPEEFINGLGRKDMIGKACEQVVGVNPFA